MPMTLVGSRWLKLGELRPVCGLASPRPAHYSSSSALRGSRAPAGQRCSPTGPAPSTHIWGADWPGCEAGSAGTPGIRAACLDPTWMTTREGQDGIAMACPRLERGPAPTRGTSVFRTPRTTPWPGVDGPRCATGAAAVAARSSSSVMPLLAAGAYPRLPPRRRIRHCATGLPVAVGET